MKGKFPWGERNLVPWTPEMVRAPFRDRQAHGLQWYQWFPNWSIHRAASPRKAAPWGCSCLFCQWLVIWGKRTRRLVLKHSVETWGRGDGPKTEETGYFKWMVLRWGFPGGASGKELTCQCGPKRCGFDPWVRKIPWRTAWQPTQVFLPGESHGQRSLAGYSPWGGKESDKTEAT